MPAYTVLVDDNFHYMDEEYRETYGAYDSYDAALAACTGIVEQALREQYTPGMTAEELFKRYRAFGEDPFIRPPGEPRFSAWTYAQARAEEICAGPGGPTAPPPPTPAPAPAPPTGTWPCNACDATGRRRVGLMAVACPACRGCGGWGGGFSHRHPLPSWLPYDLARALFGRGTYP